MNVALLEPASTGARTSRLTVSLSGTNLARAGDYNQRVVLQAIRLSGETCRGDLVRVTGLTAPTIANITRRLVRDGLARETGRVAQGRGQPAVRLAINADGAFGIGLAADRDRLSLVCLDLCGKVRTRVAHDGGPATPESARDFVAAQLPPLLAAAGIDPTRVVGAGFALPDAAEGWDGFRLDDLLPGPLLRDNDAAAAALAELHLGAGRGRKSFFYLLFCAGLGGGLVIDGDFYRGATGRSGEIGYLTATTSDGTTVRLEERVSLAALHRRLADAGCEGGDQPATHKMTESWIEEAATLLLPALSAVDCLLDPETIIVGGRLPPPTAEALAARLDTLLAGESLPTAAPVQTGLLGRDAPAIGAALLPFLDRLLPSDAILMNAAP